MRIQVDALSNNGCLLEYVGTRDSMAMSLLIGKGRGDAASCNITPTPKTGMRCVIYKCNKYPEKYL